MRAMATRSATLQGEPIGLRHQRLSFALLKNRTLRWPMWRRGSHRTGNRGARVDDIRGEPWSRPKWLRRHRFSRRAKKPVAKTGIGAPRKQSGKAIRPFTGIAETHSRNPLNERGETRKMGYPGIVPLYPGARVDRGRKRGKGGGASPITRKTTLGGRTLSFVDLPKVGANGGEGQGLWQRESVKAVSDLYSPVTGHRA